MRIKNILSGLTSKYSIFIVLLVLFIICWILNRNFMSVQNLMNISVQISAWTILALGETILIISGMLDLSSASVLALSGIVSVSIYKSTESLFIAVPAAIIIGVCCNIINGLMVTKFKTPSFIATLAMMAMARGAALMYTKGQNIVQIGNFAALGQGWIQIIFLLSILIVTHGIC
jgi:inositol transport system permease protein